MPVDDLEQFIQDGRAAQAPPQADDLEQFISGGRNDGGFSVQPEAPVAQTPSAPERTALGTLQDVGVSLVKSAVGVPEAVVGLADIVTGGRAGKLAEDVGIKFQETQNILDTMKSPAQQAAKQRVSDASGFLGTAQAALENPSTIASTVLESGGQILLGGGFGRLIGGVAKLAELAPAIGEGIVGAGSAAESIRQQSDTGLTSVKQNALALGIGALTTIFGALGQKVAKSLNISDIDVLASGGNVAEAAAKKNIAVRVVQGAFAEGILEELPQSVQEQVLTNIATNKEDVFSGVDKAAVMGILAGGVMGAGAQFASGNPSDPRAVDLRVRSKILLQRKQNDPSFDVNGTEAKQFLAGALILKDGEFVPTPSETQTAETQTAETQTAETQTPETQTPETQTPETQTPETQTATPLETQTPEAGGFKPKEIIVQTDSGPKPFTLSAEQQRQNAEANKGVAERKEITALVNKLATQTPETTFTDREAQLQANNGPLIEQRLNQIKRDSARSGSPVGAQTKTPEAPVLAKSGKPFKSEKSALMSATGKSLINTHEIVGVDGGYGFARRSSPLFPEAVPTEAVPTEAVPTEAVPTEAVPTEAVPTEAAVPEPVLSASGKPFKSEVSATKSSTGKRLAATHEVVPVEGGFGLRERVVDTAPMGKDPIKALHNAISRRLGVLLPKGTFTTGKAPKGQGAFFAKVGKLLGKKVVFYKNNGGAMEFDGATGVSKDTIYINESASSPHLAVVGHEFLHELKRDAPNVYEPFKAVVAPLISKKSLGSMKKFLADAHTSEGQKPLSSSALEDASVEELLGDVFAKEFTTKGFWKKVERRNPDNFGKVASKFIQFIEKVKSAFSGPQLKDAVKAQNAAADALASYLQRNPGKSEGIGDLTFMTAFHGSPHTFEKFTTDAIGTGEGAQVFGWGLYFAGRREVAEHYQEVLLAKSGKGGKGSLFQVDLAPDESEYLLWDKPLNEQSAGVQAILPSISSEMSEDFITGVEDRLNADFGEWTGRELYKALTKWASESPLSGQLDTSGDLQRDVSEYLSSVGIPGIKYLEGASRSVGEGSFNYVIFDAGDIEITVTFKRPEQAAKAADAVVKSVHNNTTKTVKRMLDLKGKFRNNLKTILAVTPLPTLVEYGSKHVRQLKEFARVIRAEEQVSSEIVSTSYELVNAAVDAAKKAGKNVGTEALHKVMMLGTDYQMTPWAGLYDQHWVPAGTPKGERAAVAQQAWEDSGLQGKVGVDYKTAHAEVSQAYNALASPEAQAAYRDIIEDVKSLRKREKNAMQTLIEDLTQFTHNPEKSDKSNADTKAALDKQRAIMLREMRQSFKTLGGAYLPLSRFGKWTATFTDPLGNEAFQKFDTSQQAEEFRAQMKAVGIPVSLSEQQAASRSIAAIPKEFLVQIQAVLDKKFMEGVDKNSESDVAAAQATIDEALDQVNQLYLRWTPETSAFKNSMLRKNVRGASQDMTRGYLAYMQSHASNVAYFEQGRKIDNIIKEVSEDIRVASKVTGSDTRTASAIRNDMMARVATNRTNKINKQLQTINRFTSLWYLSSPSIALVQMSQLGVLTYPKLAVKHGPLKAAKALTQGTQRAFMRRYGRTAMFADKQVNETFTFLHEQITESNRDSAEAGGRPLGTPLHTKEQMLKKVAGLKTQYQKELLALREGLARGVMDISFTHEVQRMAQGADPNSVVNRVQSGMMVWMQSSELASRKAAILATFNLETSNGTRGNFFTAMDSATEAVDDTLFDYSPAAKGTALQSGPARTLLMFKHFQMMMTLRQVSMVKNIFKGETKAVKKAAFQEFIGIMGMTATLAGVRGLPIAFVWAALDSILGDDDEPVNSKFIFSNWVRGTFGEDAGKAIEFGLPALFGSNVSGRVGSETIGKLGLDSPEGMHGRGLAANYATQLLGPAWGLAEGMVVAQDEMFNKGEYLRGLEAVLPKPFKDVLKSYRFATKGVKTRGGKRLLPEGELTLDDFVMTALGFPPEEVLRASEREYQKRGLSTQISERRGRLMRDFAKALDSGDTEDEIAAIIEFNKKLPRFGISGGDLRSTFRRFAKGDMMVQSRRDMLLDTQFGK